MGWEGREEAQEGAGFDPEEGAAMEERSRFGMKWLEPSPLRLRVLRLIAANLFRAAWGSFSRRLPISG